VGAARGHCTAAIRAKKHCDGASEDVDNLAKGAKTQQLQKVFNLSTYKVHTLGDYT
jgi:hypothetical protein